MVRAGLRELPWHLVLGLGLALGGCAMNVGDDGVSRAGAAVEWPGAGRQAIERDVEAPEVFDLEEAGLWDGRPSLGGVWIAHPSVRNPERVAIRNAQTGATVIGALFRRERENPGPRFQVSSEAANALGILPGAPTPIRVTALRLERIETEPERPRAPASAAIAEAPAMSPVAIPAETGTPAGAVEIASLDPEPRRGLFGGLFTRRATEPAADAAIAETPLVASPSTNASPQVLETTVALAVEPASELAPESEPRRRGLRDLFARRPAEPDPVAPALIPLPEPAPPAVVAGPAAAAPDRPFVQIGIFSIESNAQNAQRQMQQAGLSAEIRRGRANDRDFWRVVIGPAADLPERGRLLERARGLGFADAYAVVR